MQTRRNILAALAVAPVAIAAPAVAMSSSPYEWNAALDKYEKAAAAHIAAATEHMEADEFFDQNAPKQPPGRIVFVKDGRAFTPDEAVANFNAEQGAWRTDLDSFRLECKLDELDALAREAARAEYEALTAMLRCRAPDLTAVAKKIELASEYGCSAWELEPIIDDLRRIGGAV